MGQEGGGAGRRGLPRADRQGRCETPRLEACGNPRLRDLLGAITEVPLQLSTFRRYSIDELRRSAAQHAELVSALMVGDADWARSVMTAHIRSARHTLLQAPVAIPIEAIG